MSAIVQVKSLSKSFGSLKAVQDLSFSVERSDIYGFLGQNGAGKSTTIRMLLTLIRPSGGEIELFGLNLKTHRREILQQVGAVIERPDLYKYLSGIENLSLFAKMNQVDFSRKRMMEQLELVGLADRAESRVKTYSQGMKQRLGIAVALVHDPQLIILDEPTNGLDPQGIADMRNLIMHLCHHMDKTVIVSSHLLSEIEQIATRMIIIDHGSKVVEGRVDELVDPAKTVVELETTDSEKTRNYLTSSPWQKVVTGFDEQKVLLQMHREQIPALNYDLVQQGIGVLSLQTKNSLENYFLHVTAGKQHVGTFAN
ncbi:MAG: ABC transporter ATP-binding protein [Chitinophagaceae bacterium]